MQFVVLAGGLGTRLAGTIADGVPKPMAPVAGRPFLERLLDLAIDGGAHEVVLLVGHRASAIIDHFGPAYRGLSLRYLVEETPLGTGGAIRNAVDALSEHFILLNGDTYAPVDFRALISHLADDPLAMTLAPVDDAGRFGAVDVDHDRVARLVEKGVPGPGLINAGVYACTRELVASLPEGRPSSFEVNVLQAHVPVLRPRYERTYGAFFDIGVPEDHARADAYFAGVAEARSRRGVRSPGGTGRRSRGRP